MIDKIVSVLRSAIADEIGECDATELEAVEDALAGIRPSFVAG